MISGAREPLRPDLREALRYLGVRGEPEPELARRLEAAADRLAALPPPVWRWEVYDLERLADGMALAGTALELTGSLAAEMLSGCDRAAVLVCTLGMEWERLYARTALTDAGEALLLDACGSALVEQAADLAEAELRAAVPDAFLTDRFSPGYGDLPLALQDAVLRLLETERRLGVWLTAGGLAVPAKTVTAFIGLAKEPQPARIRGCEVCPLRKDCGGTRCRCGN